MPRYFFHVLDGKAAIDDTGLILADESEAQIEALRGAGEMLADGEMTIWLGNEWLMAVTDENGAILFKLKFSVEHPTRSPALLS
ncbi:hypothetical protein [Rhizobium sp. LC145]|uniref:DUF6894 family protein n=1 Tax=Rhizobium sp. LC145 TaxID=1120688 RepID=UPI00062A0D35|nr:hypothetical protein [Rhizobium sp. LC145]KKX29196.1 hypothetical protein YH62_15460 [Rhizobium sp. LC145]